MSIIKKKTGIFLGLLKKNFLFFFHFEKNSMFVCSSQFRNPNKQTFFSKLFKLEKNYREISQQFSSKKKFLFSTNWQWRKKIAEKNILIMTYLIIIRCSFVVRCNHVNLEKYGFFLFFVCKKNINLTQISIYKEFYGIEMMMICSIIVKLLYS